MRQRIRESRHTGFENHGTQDSEFRGEDSGIVLKKGKRKAFGNRFGKQAEKERDFEFGKKMRKNDAIGIEY